MRPAASCPPCAPDVAGAYNVNSSSGCGRPRPLRPEVAGVCPDALHATRRRPPSNPAPSGQPYRPVASHAPPCMLPVSRRPATSISFSLTSPTNPPPYWVSSHDTLLPPDSVLSFSPYLLSVPNPLKHSPFRSLPPNPIAYPPVSSGRAPALHLFAPYLRTLLPIPPYSAEALYHLSHPPDVLYHPSRPPDALYNPSCPPDVSYNLSRQRDVFRSASDF